MDKSERSKLTQLILKDEVYAIAGAAIEVHRELGPGFLESVYQEAMKLELSARSVPFEAEKPISIEYKGQRLSQNYFADLVCFGQIIVELKALSRLSGSEQGPSSQLPQSHRFQSWRSHQLRQPRQSWNGSDLSDNTHYPRKAQSYPKIFLRAPSCPSWILPERTELTQLILKDSRKAPSCPKIFLRAPSCPSWINPKGRN